MTMLEYAGQFRRARRAVAFANQVFRRIPPFVARNVLVDEIRENLRVLHYAVKLRRVLSWRGAAVAGRNGVDENKISGIQERVFVVLDGIGRRHAVAIRSENDFLWPHSHVREE